MATSLGGQLRQLAIAQGRESTASERPGAKPSLLFSPSEAADVDLLTIYGLARAGIEELAEMDGSFEPFKNGLFSQESTQIDRELQTRKFNHKLNTSLSGYLHLLCNYLLLPPAHQTLEYLIRRYKVHVYNVEDLCLSILPYHETSVFVRIVQMLHLENTRWAFLAGVKDSGAAPPRETLVQHCTQDMAFLEAMVGFVGFDLTSKSKVVTSFVAVMLMETVAAVSTVSTEIVAKMLPFVLQGFNKGASEDHRVGALMVAGALVSRTTLSVSLIDTLFNVMAKSFQQDVNQLDSPARMHLPLMVMIQMAQTQNLEKFPLKAFKFLVKVRDLSTLLTEFSKLFNIKSFLGLYLDTLVEHSVLHQHYEQVLADAIRNVPLGNHVQSMVFQLVRLASPKQMSESNKVATPVTEVQSKDVVKRLLLLMKDHYPEELGNALNDLMQDVGKSRMIDDEEIGYLREVFSKSLYVPVAESRTTFLHAIDHIDSRVRERAIRQLSGMSAFLTDSQYKEEMSLLHGIMLRRLYDEDLIVVREVLKVQGLVKLVTPEPLFQALVSIISRCSRIEETGDKYEKQITKALLKAAFGALSADFLDQYPNYLEQVTLIVLGYLLVSSKNWRLNLFLIKQATHIPADLFTKLADIKDDLLHGKDKLLSKEDKEAWIFDVNREIIVALSSHFVANPSSCFPLLRNAVAVSSKAKALSLLVIYDLLKKMPRMDTPFAHDCLGFLKEVWDSTEAQADGLLFKLDKIDYSIDFPLPDLYKNLESEPTYAQMKILLHDFLLLLTQMKNDVEDATCHEVLSGLFYLFATSTHKDLFKPHVKLLLQCLSSTWMAFLAQFFVAGSRVVVAVQIYSLDVLASQFCAIANSYGSGSMSADEIEHDLDIQLESTLPSLLVALGSSTKAIRQSAIKCLFELHKLWTVHGRSVPRNGADQKEVTILSADISQGFLEDILDCRDNFVSDGTYLASFFTMTLRPVSELSQERFTNRNSEAIILYLLHHIVLLPADAQTVLLLALRGTGYTKEKYLATQKLLHQLLRKWKEHCIQQKDVSNSSRMSHMELLLLNILLEVNLSHVSSVLKTCSSLSIDSQNQFLAAFFDVFEVLGALPADPDTVQPCLTSLKFITSDLFTALHSSIQDVVFRVLIDVSMSNEEEVRLAGQDVLNSIDIPAKTMTRHIQLVHITDDELASGKKRKTLGRDVSEDNCLSIIQKWPVKGRELNSITALLEFLLMKPTIKDREKLWKPLFGLLKYACGKEWLKHVATCSEDYHVTSDQEKKASSTESSKGTYILHLLLMVLEKLASSALEESSTVKEEIQKVFSVDAVVTCIKMASDGVTRNYAVALLTSAGKLFPESVLNHVLEVFSVIGASTFEEDDSHAQEVMQEMLAAVVPSWISSHREPGALLQAFSLLLLRVPIQRRMTLGLNFLRAFGEERGLHTLIYVLLQQCLENTDFMHKLENGVPSKNTLDSREWQISFLEQLCMHYPPHIRVQGLVKLLNHLQLELQMSEEVKETQGNMKTKLWLLQQVVAKFIADQVQNLEHLLHEAMGDAESIQDACVALVEQALSILQYLGAYPSSSSCPPRKVRKDSQNAAYLLLDSITEVMTLPSFFQAISSLLKHENPKIRRRVVKMYIAKLQKHNMMSKSEDTAKPARERNLDATDLHEQIINQIVNFLGSPENEIPFSTKQDAVLALDLSAKRFSLAMPLSFISCLSVLTAIIKSPRKPLAFASIRCSATILSELGPQVLPVFPEFMTELLQYAKGALPLSPTDTQAKPRQMERSEAASSLLFTLRVLVEKLGAFLSPYLEDIIHLLMLQPRVLEPRDDPSGSDTLKILCLLPDKIPARLLLDPLILSYKIAVESGPESTCVILQILAQMAAKLDRPSVAAYHGKIFEFCLIVFDIRRKPPMALATSVSLVENDAIAAFVALAMKLSEKTFKPLFVTLMEWAETTVFDNTPTEGRSVHRNIVFYKIVNQLADKLRSIFVPYFQYLVDSCIFYLTYGQADMGSISSKKKRKLTKFKDHTKGDNGMDLDPSLWHMRALVISALHKCFLFDTIGFLDASRFQTLLEPIVSQMVLEGPSDNLAEKSPDMPSIPEVDDLLVQCLGQMALTAGSDALCKPLNHEVLMRTRSENIRARRLGLEVVKFMAERLKEEYLVLLPETIPFLAELLEDEDLSIIAKTQEVVKLLEQLSGESLSQYF